MSKDDGLDSIDTTEIVALVEQHFNVQVGWADISSTKTVGDLLDLIELRS